MPVPSQEEEGGLFGIKLTTQPCGKVSATETANSTVSQICCPMSSDGLEDLSLSK